MSRDVYDKLAEISKSQAVMLSKQEDFEAAFKKHSELLERHNETLLRLTITVERHEERSTKLEIRQDYLDKSIQIIKDHITRLQGAGHMIKMIGIVCGVAGSIGGAIWGLAKFLQNLGI